MELVSTIKTLQHNLTLLVDVLQREQDTLLRPQTAGTEDGELLQKLALEKQDLFQELELVEGDHAALGAALADRESSTASGRKSRKAKPDLALWPDVRELALQASRINQLNGVLIRHRLIHNQRVLNSLQQMGGPMLYNAGGAAAVGSRLSSLA